ncbi:CPBP family intramembrane glutamic endopeptidase [Halorubrum vacuolatum]|uniref:CAAX protease self-immunity n=1 Tax=Halorubrum vacuolatum TaxID=63740 RepID=A0A238Y7R9_HALVU|nr:CPBP family intramembrane glutamic endopeptidase [Halorubrum vacuolatum]SNR67275.1 CAAX protease self-immunity [Halorubrum vacuolatum]
MTTDAERVGWPESAPLVDVLDGRRWIATSLIVGAILTVGWNVTTTGSIEERLLRDGLLFLVIPGVLGLLAGEHLGWRIDRLAIRNTVLLSLFVAPFYLVGSTLPTVREHYPMWPVVPELGAFVPHAVQLLVLALAAETYYRGLLCVGVREIGFKCVFISPVAYAIAHVHSPPIELLLSAPADVLFGAVDYHANSILPSFVAHGFGLVLLDWLVLHDPIVEPERVVRHLDWLPVPL